jgi:hypothetical protein
MTVNLYLAIRQNAHYDILIRCGDRPKPPIDDLADTKGPELLTAYRPEPPSNKLQYALAAHPNRRHRSAPARSQHRKPRLRAKMDWQITHVPTLAYRAYYVLSTQYQVTVHKSATTGPVPVGQSLVSYSDSQSIPFI